MHFKRSGICQVLGRRAILDKTAKDKVPPEQNHTPKQEILMNKVMQRALVGFTEPAN